jgi:hypothetical protein
MVKRLILLATLLAMNGTVAADDDLQLRLHPGMTGVIDIGTTECATFSDMHYNGPRGMQHHVLTWTQGYVYAKTGSNIEAMLDALPEDNGWDFDSLTGIILDFCKAAPQAMVSEAAMAIYQTLSAGESAP